MFDKEHRRFELGSNLPNETGVDGEPLDVAFISGVQKDRRSWPAEAVLIDQIPQGKSLRVSKVKVIQSGIVPPSVIFW